VHMGSVRAAASAASVGASVWLRTRDDWAVGAVRALIDGVIGHFVNQIT
jgi:hypothetical protein